MQNAFDVLVLLSGGIDSMACVHFFQNLGRNPCALHINYGQSASSREMECAELISNHFGIKLFTAHWKPVLEKGAGYIPARNAFLLIAALMEKPQITPNVAIGVHSGTSYSDCSPIFIEKVQAIYDIYSNGKVHILCPFINFSKSDIYSYCINSKLPISMTYSCETGSTPCGECLSCKDREMLNGHS